MAEALQLEPVPVTVTGAATLDSPYPVTDFAAASIATAGVALASLLDALGLGHSTVTVRRELSEGWFAGAVRPVGWSPPPPWDAIAGDYLASDGWIRLHTNAPAHRAAALRVLGVEAVRESVARAVAAWQAEALETAVVDEGGCAAVMRSPAEWAKHPQGAAVAREPLVDGEKTDEAGDSFSRWQASRERPLAGLRVLDLTRVLAGPVATRLLAGLGADVLRIDPPDWDEPALVPDMTLGKRSARLDARDPGRPGPADRAVARQRRDRARLSAGRARAARARREGAPGDPARPGRCLTRRLRAHRAVGESAGVRQPRADVERHRRGRNARDRGGACRPRFPCRRSITPPVTLAAAAVLAGLAVRVREGRGWRGRLSLARTAVELENARGLPRASHFLDAVDLPADPLATPWGRAMLLHPPLELGGVAIRWDHAPRDLGADDPRW